MRHWKAIVIVAAVLSTALPVAYYVSSSRNASAADARLEHGIPTNPDALDPPALAGVLITQMEIGATEVTAPAADKRTAHLSLDPDLMSTTRRLFKKREVPEGAVVMMDLQSGRLLIYAGTSKDGTRDVCAEAKAPAASTFKIITGAALVERAGLGPDTKQCYAGGLHGITMRDLVEDEKRDRWCATLTNAMGRSLNAVFARLALTHLDPAGLTATAKSFGFGAPVPFDLPVEPSAVSIPDDDLEFARSAAGFWNTTLSPLQGMMLASIVAMRGQVMQPVLVNSVTDEEGDVLYRAPAAPRTIRQAIKPETADALRTMMNETVDNGTAHSTFFDRRGSSYLPGIQVSSKTGTLTSPKTQAFYTWLVGFAPAEKPEVAFAVLVTNGPKWRTKAPFLAREVLRAYFASRGAKGVTAP
jgi:cell division protein FtsI/penicillin-binding protein 2